MATKSTTVARTSTTRPSLADMKAALATRQPVATTTESDPISITIGRGLAHVPTFFDAVITSYRFHRNQ